MCTCILILLVLSLPDRQKLCLQLKLQDIQSLAVQVQLYNCTCVFLCLQNMAMLAYAMHSADDLSGTVNVHVWSQIILSYDDACIYAFGRDLWVKNYACIVLSSCHAILFA